MFDHPAAMSRWRRVREMMVVLDIDVILAIDVSRDEILLGHQRWLTGYIPVGSPAAVLVHRDGAIELISDRLGKPVPEYYRANNFPIALVNGLSDSVLVEHIARFRPCRVGFVGAESMSWTLAEALIHAIPQVELVDISASMLALRMRKSPDEIVLIRQSAAIADKVWEHVGDIVRIGRLNYEVVADIDHLVRLHGAEGGFNFVFRLPFLGRAMRSTANPERIEANTRYLVEISPRLEGYYSQVTLPVTTRADDTIAYAAFEDIVAAKGAVQHLMRPGVDLTEIGRLVADFMAERGRKLSSPSLGHFCGMALEEPRHDPTRPLVLEAGMTMIFHPVLGDAELHGLMRADTYLITDDGAERLTRFPGGMLTIR